MSCFEISDMHVLAGWIVIVGSAYLYLDARRRSNKKKQQRQPKYYKDKF
jgi:hypothetical protein